MSLGLVGKTGPEVLEHRNEPLLDLHVLRVGLHVPLGDVVAEHSLEESPTAPSCCCRYHGRARPTRHHRESWFL